MASPAAEPGGEGKFWEYTSPAWAGMFLDFWCYQTMRSRIEPMKKIARTLRAHRTLLLNYFKARKQFSSGVIEGLNNKAKVTMRRSYGFRTFRILELARELPSHLTSDLPISCLGKKYAVRFGCHYSEFLLSDVLIRPVTHVIASWPRRFNAVPRTRQVADDLVATIPDFTDPNEVGFPSPKVTVLKNGGNKKYWSLDSVASMGAFFHLQKKG
jgi:hypothetical protein